jgi:hypothetical protein
VRHLIIVIAALTIPEATQPQRAGERDKSVRVLTATRRR